MDMQTGHYRSGAPGTSTFGTGGAALRCAM